MFLYTILHVLDREKVRDVDKDRMRLIKTLILLGLSPQGAVAWVTVMIFKRRECVFLSLLVIFVVVIVLRPIFLTHKPGPFFFWDCVLQEASHKQAEV